MANWNDDLKQDLQNITLSTAMKQKIIQQQPKKRKTSSIMPTVLSVIVFATMFFFLYNTNFTQLNNASVVIKQAFQEVYVEREEYAGIKMHRSGLYSKIAKLDEEGMNQFQQYWHDKVRLEREAPDNQERQFLAYTENGEKVAGVLFHENEKLYMSVNDIVYKIPKQSANYTKTLGVSTYDFKILMLMLLFLLVLAYYDSYYEIPRKKSRILNVLMYLTAMYFSVFNAYIPIIFLLFIIYILIYAVIKEDKIIRYKLLLHLNYIYLLVVVGIGISIYFFFTFSEPVLISLFIVYLIGIIYSEKMMKHTEPPKCSTCSAELSFKQLLMSYFKSHTNCVHCKNTLALNKKRVQSVTAQITLSLLVLSLIAYFLHVALVLIIMLFLVVLVQLLITTVITLAYKKEKEPLL